MEDEKAWVMRTKVYTEEPSSLAARSERKTPETPYEAMMQAPPGEEPEMSSLEKEPLLEIIGDAVDALPERQKWIIQAVWWRGLSLQEAGDEIGISKTQAHRDLHAAYEQLRETLGVDLGIDPE